MSTMPLWGMIFLLSAMDCLERGMPATLPSSAHYPDITWRAARTAVQVNLPSHHSVDHFPCRIAGFSVTHYGPSYQIKAASRHLYLEKVRSTTAPSTHLGRLVFVFFDPSFLELYGYALLMAYKYHPSAIALASPSRCVSSSPPFKRALSLPSSVLSTAIGKGVRVVVGLTSYQGTITHIHLQHHPALPPPPAVVSAVKPHPCGGPGNPSCDSAFQS
ncbi:hypothetical protein SISNIDRAFT_488335 [Sistotremastrum niveocremeum HHB9708]|uniref:Uncharacterized protein n=1 Tax=Sistotremastrum niveocremeum HHB9708 TaxID=1314777 RepID=A0A164RD72_9AGAM|nr:hypothetical protein SISNIDRAFT_488335 [Sistotremastrum niveocremeum HHB9708]